jgi:drug/metabolite transporter (DMT)-like permease
MQSWTGSRQVWALASAAFAILFLGERLTLLHGLGIALITGGAILAAL